LHPSATTSRSDGKTYTYDNNGNMLTGAGKTFTWDVENRLASVTQGSSTSFLYDYTGMRETGKGSGVFSRSLGTPLGRSVDSRPGRFQMSVPKGRARCAP
jgi:hypothetical protein